MFRKRGKTKMYGNMINFRYLSRKITKEVYYYIIILR